MWCAAAAFDLDRAEAREGWNWLNKTASQMEAQKAAAQ